MDQPGLSAVCYLPGNWLEVPLHALLAITKVKLGVGPELSHEQAAAHEAGFLGQVSSPTPVGPSPLLGRPTSSGPGLRGGSPLVLPPLSSG